MHDGGFAKLFLFHKTLKAKKIYIENTKIFWRSEFEINYSELTTRDDIYFAETSVKSITMHRKRFRISFIKSLLMSFFFDNDLRYEIIPVVSSLKSTSKLSSRTWIIIFGVEHEEVIKIEKLRAQSFLPFFSCSAFKTSCSRPMVNEASVPSELSLSLPT